jgi:hypothetical protein
MKAASEVVPDESWQQFLPSPERAHFQHVTKKRALQEVNPEH